VHEGPQLTHPKERCVQRTSDVAGVFGRLPGATVGLPSGPPEEESRPLQSLFNPQRDHRIDVRRPPRRHQRRDTGDQGE
jgi:hypothetical protein